ncbi:MAG: hypothetical protein KDC28_02355 [Saprospiraceae bacterium]|nr:hypothetical protein [Saprospiraceae bacterium]MCB9320292.1 VOC family protein [Lewinellaceae bacterium]
MKNPKASHLQPWLVIAEAAKAIAFYKQAFNMQETYRMEDPGGGLVVRLESGPACIWVSNDPDDGPLGGGNVRMILIVPDPDSVFSRAIAAGATAINEVREDYGWRLGRLEDPFGLHWEVGFEL